MANHPCVAPIKMITTITTTTHVVITRLAYRVNR